MKYKGSCHCGCVKFEAEGELEQVMACNCSICSRKGSLMWFIPRDKFCPTCGIHTFGEGVDPSGKRMAAINTRCLEGVDFPALPVMHFDGRSL